MKPKKFLIINGTYSDQTGFWIDMSGEKYVIEIGEGRLVKIPKEDLMEVEDD